MTTADDWKAPRTSRCRICGRTLPMTSDRDVHAMCAELVERDRKARERMKVGRPLDDLYICRRMCGRTDRSFCREQRGTPACIYVPGDYTRLDSGGEGLLDDWGPSVRRVPAPKPAAEEDNLPRCARCQEPYRRIWPAQKFCPSCRDIVDLENHRIGELRKRGAL